MDNQKVNKKGQTLEQFLESYNPYKYPQPSVAVDMAVFTLLPDPLRLGALLIRRGNHPYIGMLAFPGGFIKLDEPLEDSAARELEEETGVTDAPLLPFGVFGDPDRDPRTRVISAAYYACVPLGAMKPKAGDDAADARIYALDVSAKETPDGRVVRIHAQDKKGDSGATQVLLAPQKIGRVTVWTASQLPQTDMATDHGLLLLRALQAMVKDKQRSLLQLLPDGFTKETLEQVQDILNDIQTAVCE